ncbi:uncharacterized protein LOC135847616 isoform X9 [Planococcus citri]|uniref:uncharacterized protein LOC135847616 isoform X9 n=1 Tax=Planococcus citri TaxID=170843 RepID=UPI0031F77508
MTEMVPVEFAQPTPLSLKELSAISVSLGIWRNEIHKCRINHTIENFNPLTLKISSKTLLPDLPLVLYDVIDEYVSRFGPSAATWLYNHYKRIFQSYHCHENSVLEVFDDFIADYYGTIDYVRTAKRMIACDRFSEVEKFAVACTYFFEDDINRIWPSVCESFDLNSTDFGKCPQLFYWICRLRNEMDKIPTKRNTSVDEVMFDHHMVENRPSLEYFWGHMSLGNRMRKATDTYRRDKKLLVTFVLPKLNDQQLDEFLNTKGCKLILNLLNDRLRNRWFFQPTWKLIKSKVNESTFRTLVVEMLKFEQASAFEGCSRQPQNWLFHCSLIWNSITDDLKQSIVEDILSNRALFENMRPFFFSSERRFVGFLLIIISSASVEQRSRFWCDCGPHLIEGTRSEDLLRIMKLCFENKEEIVEFKVNILAECETVRRLCSRLLRVGMFDELNDLVDFCWHEVQAAKDFKLLLLRSTFLLETCGFTALLVKRVKEFSVFIDDIFDDKDQSTDFKNQLVSSPAARDILLSYPCAWNSSIEALMELVDTFVSTEQTLHGIKKGMIGYLTEFILKRRDNGYFKDRRFKTSVFDQFLLWLLGSAEEVERFRQTCLL